MSANNRHRVSPVLLWVCLVVFAGLAPRAPAAPPLPAAQAKPALGGDFTLTDDNGGRYSLRRDRGKVVVLFFGYTSCPDVCPTTLQTVTRVLHLLGERAREVRVLFVSVDPGRDTPERLKAYLRYFDPTILGLTGDAAELRAITEKYGTYYRYHGDVASGNYSADHGSGLYLIDRRGRLASIIPYGTQVDTVAAIVRRALDAAAP